MKRSQVDVVPVLGIIAGGLVGLVASGAAFALLVSGEAQLADQVSVEVVVHAPSTPALVVARADEVEPPPVSWDPVGQARELVAQQEALLLEVTRLPEKRADRGGQLPPILDKKDHLLEGLQVLERDMVRYGGDGARGAGEPGVLSTALGSLIDSKLPEKVAYSRSTIAQWEVEAAVTLELTIQQDLQVVTDILEEGLNRR